MMSDKVVEVPVEAAIPPAGLSAEAEAGIEEQYPMTHVGWGRYSVDGVTYQTKAEAEVARNKLLSLSEYNDTFGDVMPKGYEIRVTDRSLVFRDSVLEVPMNEVYLPDGGVNPMYDREWHYAWAARRARSVSEYRTLGYYLMTHKELSAMVDKGKAPAHYLSLLQRDGDNLVFEDLVLMRTPRPIWRQRKAEQAAQTREKIRNRQREIVHEVDARLKSEDLDLGM